VLLAVYIGSQLASTFLMSSTMDKTQRTLFLVMPIAFVFFLLNFPTGLLIYWVTTNLWTMGQGLITRRLMPKPQPPAKRSSRTPAGGGTTDDDVAADTAAAPAPSAPPAPPRRVRRKKKGKARQ
jgi:YidC/Oxa1 family membrane protein insertase